MVRIWGPRDLLRADGQGLIACEVRTGLDYDPTIEDSYNKQTGVDGTTYMLHIIDTAGQDDYSMLQDQYYQSAQGFLMVYSVTSRLSFEELESRFREKILLAKDSQRVPMVLVGNKIDLADQREVKTSEGAALAAAWGCPFIETSAATNTNVADAFKQLVREVNRFNDMDTEAQRKKKKKSSCTLL